MSGSMPKDDVLIALTKSLKGRPGNISRAAFCIKIHTFLTKAFFSDAVCDKIISII